ncbi:post-transcriptional regulator [Numidum massiliense]|uniref:post-transcriptional regulator n=1 Tax=Numidum massiliense TaxID=1522315 RepID=UPI0028FCA2A5|nr:post-transcriptional regulator [Numidum massiliense]
MDFVEYDIPQKKYEKAGTKVTDYDLNTSWEKEDLEDVIEKLCASKAEEFEFYGYENISGREIWLCVSKGYEEQLPALHKLVNDILSLKVTDFMNWMTVNAYKGVDLT